MDETCAHILDPIPDEQYLEARDATGGKPAGVRFLAFNTIIDIEAYGEAAACRAAFEKARALCRLYERLFSRTLPHSDIARINSAHGQPVAIDQLPAGDVVGASTGLPLVDDGPGFAAPFAAAGIDPASVFYFGESVLLPAWRGQGLGHAFFDARERHAQALGGFALTAFAAVERADDDPRRPSGHRDHAMFWAGRGYTRQPGLVMQLAWQEVGHASVDHRLTFWTRPLPGAGHPEP